MVEINKKSSVCFADDEGGLNEIFITGGQTPQGENHRWPPAQTASVAQQQPAQQSLEKLVL